MRVIYWLAAFKLYSRSGSLMRRVCRLYFCGILKQFSDVALRATLTAKQSIARFLWTLLS
jgi:hypothetical protein